MIILPPMLYNNDAEHEFFHANKSEINKNC